MKKIKMVCVVLSLILIAGIFSACSISDNADGKGEKEKITVTVISDIQYNVEQKYWSIGVDVLDKEGNILPAEEAADYVERISVPDLNWYYDNKMLFPVTTTMVGGNKKAEGTFVYDFFADTDAENVLNAGYYRIFIGNNPSDYFVFISPDNGGKIVGYSIDIREYTFNNGLLRIGFDFIDGKGKIITEDYFKIDTAYKTADGIITDEAAVEILKDKIELPQLWFLLDNGQAALIEDLPADSAALEGSQELAVQIDLSAAEFIGGYYRIYFNGNYIDKLLLEINN